MLLTAGTVLTGRELLRPGWIEVSGSRITAVGAGGPPSPADRDLPSATVVPGFVDTHVHGGGGASFSGGAALNMGTEYLLMSIAVVVIGGTAVAGGNSNVPGIWGASLFMFLVVSMLNTYGFGAGIRLILTGLIIIVVIMLPTTRSAGKT